jgi:hypothetical protein
MNVQMIPVYSSICPPVYSQQINTIEQHNKSLLPPNPTPQEIIVYLTNKPSQWNNGLCDCCDIAHSGLRM